MPPVAKFELAAAQAIEHRSLEALLFLKNNARDIEGQNDHFVALKWRNCKFYVEVIELCYKHARYRHLTTQRMLNESSEDGASVDEMNLIAGLQKQIDDVVKTVKQHWEEGLQVMQRYEIEIGKRGGPYPKEYVANG